jgi:hypothetical protein
MHDHSSVCVRPNLLLGDSIFFKDCHSRYNKAGEQIFWQVAYQLTAFIEICILYPEFLARLAKYLCQRLKVLQESCKMAKFLKYNKLATSVIKIYLNTSITGRYQAFVRLKNRWIFFNRRFLSLITPRISSGSRNMH